MLTVGWFVLAVVLAVLLSMWVTFTLTRLDRLHARVDAAWAALDAQLVRRAAALQHVAEDEDSGAPSRLRGPCERAALDALGVVDAKRSASVDVDSYRAARQSAENAVGHRFSELDEIAVMLHPRSLAELREGAARVQVARRFYNDAVRDTRALRSRRMPRLLHLAGRRALPEFFDIDDSSTIPGRALGAAPLAAAPAAEPNRPQPDMRGDE